VKSFREAHPDFGFASALVDVQRYVDGRVHVVVDADVVELAGFVTEVEIIVELAPVHGIH
jgi:hypothetical protein